MNQKILFKSFLSFVFFAFFVCASTTYAAQLVNINTADIAELETLPGVGPSIAQSIIDNRPYSTIEEVSNASGIGEPGSSSYQKIKDLITVVDESAQTQTQSATAEMPVVQQNSSGEPPLITVRINAPLVVTAGGGSLFDAQAYGTKNLPIISGVRFIWNFGDGVVVEGQHVFHTYAYPGRYSVLVTAAYNYSSAMSRITVDAVDAAVSLVTDGNGSLVIQNMSKNNLDIGSWSLSDNGKLFVIPEDTVVLAGEGVRFAASVTELDGSNTSALLYPNGALAAAASVSANSPLRGERVINKPTAPALKVATARGQDGEVLGDSTYASATVGSAPSPLLLSVGALFVLLAGSVGAVHYLGLSAKYLGTNDETDGFKIE